MLLKNGVLTVQKGRNHSQFNINMNPFFGLNYQSMFQWIEKKTEILKLKIACREGDLSGSDSESSTDEDED